MKVETMEKWNTMMEYLDDIPKVHRNESVYGCTGKVFNGRTTIDYGDDDLIRYLKDVVRFIIDKAYANEICFFRIFPEITEYPDGTIGMYTRIFHGDRDLVLKHSIDTLISLESILDNKDDEKEDLPQEPTRYSFFKKIKEAE